MTIPSCAIFQRRYGEESQWANPKARGRAQESFDSSGKLGQSSRSGNIEKLCMQLHLSWTKNGLAASDVTRFCSGQEKTKSATEKLRTKSCLLIFFEGKTILGDSLTTRILQAQNQKCLLIFFERRTIQETVTDQKICTHDTRKHEIPRKWSASRIFLRNCFKMLFKLLLCTYLRCSALLCAALRRAEICRFDPVRKLLMVQCHPTPTKMMRVILAVSRIWFKLWKYR